MKILIVGQAKSGTTALYSALKQSLPPDYTYLFEPKRYTRASGDGRELAKVLISDSVRVEEFEAFDKKILLVRDPRDNLVSRVLYEIYNQDFVKDDEKVRVFVECLERKRRDPPSVPLVELLRVLGDLSGKDLLEAYVARHRMGLNFDPRGRGYFVYKYEDFVAGRYSELERYLGYTLRFSGEVGAEYSRVTRTKGAGDWRNWFTARDVEYFRPVYQEYIARYQYDPAWEPHPEPKILPEHSTEYVMRLVRQGREHRKRSITRKVIRVIESSLGWRLRR